MAPEVGLKPLIEGTALIANWLLDVPKMLVATYTLMVPVPEAPGGTATVIEVAETLLGVAENPLKRTSVAPVKFNPVSVTVVPTGPLTGEKEIMVGSGINVFADEPVPAAFVTEMTPDVSPVGTMAVIKVELFTVK